jgi:hypothetical protein
VCLGWGGGELSECISVILFFMGPSECLPMTVSSSWGREGIWQNRFVNGHCIDEPILGAQILPSDE